VSEEFLINCAPQETRVALMYQGVVQELHIERTNGRGIVGNIYLGKVVRVLPGMQSAFIDIGIERTAFLHVADIWEQKPANGNGHEGQRPIERVLSEGQQLTVQVL
jgi:ribonuclease G